MKLQQLRKICRYVIVVSECPEFSFKFKQPDIVLPFPFIQGSFHDGNMLESSTLCPGQ